MLGDLNAERLSPTANTRLKFDQTIEGHSEYLHWLADLFKDFVGAPVKPTDRKPDKRTGKIYNSLQFQTLFFPCFNVFRDLFYGVSSTSGNKVISILIGELFTEVS